MKLYSQHGNIQLSGDIKIGNFKNFTNKQFFESLNDNICWKDFLTYSKGQICTKYISNAVSFYCSLVDDNYNNDPQQVQNINSYWKKISFGQQQNKTIILQVPPITDLEQFIFCLQLSTTNDFSTVYSLNTFGSNSPNGVFYISNQSQNNFQLANQKTFKSSDSGLFLLVDLQQFSSYKYFRCYFAQRQNINNKTEYILGALNSSTYFLNSNASNSNFTIVIDDKNIIGNGTNLYPIRINENLFNIYEIINDDSFVVSAKNNIQLNSGKNNVLKINANNISFNDNYLNSPNGLVVLGQDGKIPTSLYLNTDFSQRLLPEKKFVSQNNYGNPLVVYYEQNVWNKIGNDSSVVLLLQGVITDNQAIGATENIIYYYDSNFTVFEDQFFSGGCRIQLPANYDLFSQAFQFDIQFVNFNFSQNESDLDTRFYSLMHFISSHGDLVLLKCNSQQIVVQSYNWLQSDYNIIQLASNNINNNQQIIKLTFNCIKNGQIYNFCLYQQEVKLCEFSINYSPFSSENSNIFYFMNSVFDKLRQDVGVVGYPYKWRLLRFSNVIKNDFEKPIGQLYTTQLQSQYSNIKVGYQWSNIQDYSNINDVKLFGKINGKPVLVSYPQINAYQMPTASKSTKGGVIIGNGLKVDSNGVLSVSINGAGVLDLGNYEQQTGGITISASRISDDSCITLVSGGLQPNRESGKLFLGDNSDNNKKIQLLWSSDNIENGITINSEQIIIGNNLALNSDSNIKIDLDGSIHLNSRTGIVYNGNLPNQSNGLVVLDEDGHIPSKLLNQNGGVGSAQLTIYDSATEQLIPINSIVAGNNISIIVENKRATIHADLIGKYRSDIIVRFNQLRDGYFIIPNATVGSFAIHDASGYLVRPVQQQVNDDVWVNFNNWDFQNNLEYTVKFIRGQQGQTRNFNSDQLALMLSMCF